MKLTTKRKIAIISLAVALVGGVASMPSASAATTPSRYVTITADGSVKVVPDAVRMNATVTVIAGSSKEAQSQVSTTSASVRAALTAAKIDKKDIDFNPYSSKIVKITLIKSDRIYLLLKVSNIFAIKHEKAE
jgi:uncharacterized protein YggE